MKYSILFAAIVMLSLSCNPILYPLPGKNYDEISNIRSTKTADSSWATVCREKQTMQGRNVDTESLPSPPLVQDEASTPKMQVCVCVCDSLSLSLSLFL